MPADSTAPASRRLVDLSHPIADGLVTYPGLPAPRITPHLTREDSRSHYAPGTEFAMDVITMIGNTGTYIDSPFHRYDGGTDLAGLALESLVDLQVVVVDLGAGARAIDAADLEAATDGVDLAGTAVLLRTGWDRHFATAAYTAGAPYLTEAGAQLLVDAGVALVGIDSLNIDDTEGGGERPAHSIILGAGVPVVEHLRGLDALPATGARFTAVPPRVEGFGTFPVRAFATV